jgi:hypothetical protein
MEIELKIFCELPPPFSKIVEMRPDGAFLLVRVADGREFQVSEHGAVVPRPRRCRHQRQPSRSDFAISSRRAFVTRA